MVARRAVCSSASFFLAGLTPRRWHKQISKTTTIDFVKANLEERGFEIKAGPLPSERSYSMLTGSSP